MANSGQIVNNFVGENGVTAGTKGLVPAPAVLDGDIKGKFLSANGSWSGQTEYHSPRRESLSAISSFSVGSTTGNQWFGVCYAEDKGLFVAICASGTSRIQISRNGVLWRNIVAPANNTWTKITYAPELGRFVAVSFDGANRSMYSNDGQIWTLTTPPTGQWYDICWSPELKLFLAVGLGGTNSAMTSPDGITWTGFNPLGYTSNIYCCTWSPELSLFVTLRLNTPSLTSPDGVNWTLRNLSDKSWTAVTWAKELGLLVAVGVTGTNRCATSPDGITWTDRAIPAAAWRRVVWIADLGMLIAVSSGNNLAYSYDGITWNSGTGPSSGGQWYDLFWSKQVGRLIVTGIAGTNRAVYSRNLRNFTQGETALTRTQYLFKTTSTAFTINDNQRESKLVKTTGGALTITVPLNTTYNPAVGSRFEFAQGGTDVITFAPAVGVTIISRGGLLSSNGQGSSLKLEKTDVNEWLLSGDLA